MSENSSMSDEAVEAAAKALALKTYNKEFDTMDDYTQNFLRDSARLALDAAAPHMQAQAESGVSETRSVKRLTCWFRGHDWQERKPHRMWDINTFDCRRCGMTVTAGFDGHGLPRH